jgi:hypothetical protein
MMDKVCRTVFAILLFLPSSGFGRPEKLALKFSGGLSCLVVGDINRGIQGYFDYAKDMAIGLPLMSFRGDAKPLHMGFDLQGDVLISVSPRVWIEVGSGYISSRSESEIEIVYNAGGSPITGSHKIWVNAIPVRLGLSYLLLESGKGRLYANVGIGLYFVDYEYDKQPIGVGEVVLHQTASGKGFGLHGGLGGELKLTNKVAFIIETQARYAKVGGLRGKIKYPVLGDAWHEEEGPLYFWEWLFYNGQDQLVGKYPHVYIRHEKPSGPYVANVREAKIDFSGFSLMGGIKLYF